MKIAILTQPLHNNYGGILQNYALQMVLKELGHEPTTLDIAYTEPKWSFPIRATKCIWRFIKKVSGDRNVLFCDVKRQWEFMNHPGDKQKEFIQTNIKSIHFTEELNEDFCKQYKYEAYVVGSDQVWRPRFSPYILNYFLDFTKGQDVKRIAYAASFGTDMWEGSALDTVNTIPLIRQFNAVSVREESGISLCWNVFGVNAKCVLDPTLLLPIESYKALLKNSKSTRLKPYLAVYVLDYSNTVKRLVKQICRERHLVASFIGKKNKKGFPSVESWLDGIMNSEYVLTDSFHGTAFSIIAHRPFITLVNSGRGASRFDSLLGKLGLKDRLISNDQCGVINAPIDYQIVDKQLDLLRKQSLQFLKHSLDGE